MLVIGSLRGDRGCLSVECCLYIVFAAVGMRLRFCSKRLYCLRFHAADRSNLVTASQYIAFLVRRTDHTALEGSCLEMELSEGYGALVPVVSAILGHCGCYHLVGKTVGCATQKMSMS